MATYYVPKLVRQLDGSRFAGSNCTMASGATALDRHTLGRKKCTGSAMRLHSGDTSGGTNLDDLDRAWHRGHSEDIDQRRMLPWTDFIAKVTAGQGAVLQVWYGTLGSYRSQTNFSGNHAIYVNHPTFMRDREGNVVPALAMEDPLASVVKNVPVSVLKAAAAMLNLGTRRVGTGYCYAAFTRRIGITTGATPSPTPPPGSVPTLILAKPPTPPEVNPMIPHAGVGLVSTHVMSLKKGQPVYKTPAGPICTRMSNDAKVQYIGTAGNGWRCVEVFTKAPYSDGIHRNTLVYVPTAAGPISKKV